MARLVFALLCAAALLAQQPAEVRISSGRISGQDTGEVRSWLGIPYAAPPTGELRWKPPRPAPAWSGVRAMDKFGPPCMQSARAGLPEPSEDCLTLNVWAPKTGSKLPVMVWIHGGAFRTGSASMPIYDGTSLARKGVVLVSIQYRLGDFGFFAHPELTKEAAGGPTGNFGLMDQVAALEWVRANIAAFGGDPGNVTIFGESAGGASVLTLMGSPKARGLFHRAISQSGGGGQAGRDLAALEKHGERLASDLGAADLKALRAMPAREILARAKPVDLGAYGPVVDGIYVTAPVRQVFAEGRQAPVPFLVGANSFEASLMKSFNVTAERVAAFTGGGRPIIRKLYGDDEEQAARELFGDALFVGPARFLAARMSQVRQPAYLYHFSYVLEQRRGQVPGAAHGSEIPFVFDNLDRSPFGKLLTEADRKMASIMSRYWVQFARTGDPNVNGLPKWPAYDAAGDKLLEFGADIAVRAKFRAAKLDFLDNLRLPR
jgi:para-nitrobenzyl esterase